MHAKKMALIVMGVCGVGKSAVAARLSAALGAKMIEADEFHSAQSREKMALGIPLSDPEREPWLLAVAEAARRDLDAGDSAIIACSSLKRRYRDLLRKQLGPCLFVHLTGTRDQVANRLTGRKGHFVGEALLDSQLATLEPLMADEAGFCVDISGSIAEVVEAILQNLRHQEMLRGAIVKM